MPMDRPSRHIHLPVLAVVLLACAGGARGQTALGDGRGLERNPQVGYGGRNAEAPRISEQIRLNNAIITGNAPSGRSFRGSVGYGSVSDFRGRVGSDDLFAFRRDSAISGAFGSGVRGTDALRYQFALSTGQSVPDGFGRLSEGVQRSGSTITSANAAALRSTADFTAVRSFRPSIVGGRIDEQGYEWTAQASPLSGLSWTRSRLPVVRVGSQTDPQAQYDLGATLQAPSAPAEIGSRFVPGSTGLEPSAAGLESMLDRAALGGSDDPLRSSTRVSPAYEQILRSLSRVVDTKANVEAPGGQAAGTPGAPNAEPGAQRRTKPEIDRSLEAQLARLRQSLGGKPQEPVLTAEQELSRRISPDSSRTPGANFAPGLDRPPPARADGANKPDEAASTRGAGREALMDQTPEARLDPATGRPADDDRSPESERYREENDRSFDPLKRGTPIAERNREPMTAGELLTPEIVRALRNVGAVRVDTLSIRPVDPSDRPIDRDAYSEHMRLGEEAMSTGRYFHAEDRFTRALAALPGDPMARVGRVHAQLGAGLYLSASSNLRRLFADHPELIGATYGPALTPNNERADRIADQLRADMKKELPGLGTEAALLLAYLGQIRQDAPLIQEGLLEMTRRWDLKNRGEATLLETLRATWAR